MIKNRVTYGIILTAALVMVYFENGRMSYTFLYAVLLMPAISALMCRISLYGLSVSQMVEKDLIIKGEETRYHIAAYNRNFFITPLLTFKFTNPGYAVRSDAENAAVTLPGRSEDDISFSLSCVYKGIYYVGLQSVQALDFLGLFALNRQWRDKTRLVVYPRVIEIERFPLSMNLMSKSYSRFQTNEEDYSAISDVRPYLPSDSMKRIHWKLSAKKNSFITKNYENTALNSAVIFWDRLSVTGDEEYRVIAEDKIVEIAVAISYYCLKKMIPVDLHYGAGEPLTAANISDFEKLYACCAHSEFNLDESVGGSFAVFLNGQTNPVNITIITSQLTDILFDELTGAFYFGHHVILIYIPPERESDLALNIFDMLREIGMYAYRIDINQNILEYF
ncbi:MAG: DUF58 domain-containing protein [Clostridiales bacterium]|jgi:uncharacterized protein (DUF58 family)|nr:DUF58 domain-containing protein [Clostridiales bacterium]